MSGMYLFATFLCLALGSALGVDVMEGNYNVTAMCTTVKVGTQLGSIVSCQNYYVCTSQGPIIASCQTDYSYNYKTQACAPSSQVNCYYGVSNPCTGRTGNSWVPIFGTCNQWTYCNNDKAAGSGMCEDNEYFDVTSQQCKYGSCFSTGPSTDGVSNFNPCQVVPPNMYFGAVDNCQTWNYCNSDGSLTTRSCETSAFIVSSGKCGYSTNGACDRVTETPVPTSCTGVGTVTGDPKTCGNYLVCNGKTYIQKQCPVGYYFDATNGGGCVLRQNAVPTKGCNRCQYTTAQFVNAVNSSLCNTYYYCNNGLNGPSSTCPPKFFFNEYAQACAPNSGLQKYVLTYEACRSAPVPSIPPSGGQNPPTGGQEPPTGGQEPPTGGQNPPTGGQNPPTGGQEPPTGGQEPPTGGQEPPTGGENPPADGQDTSAGGQQPPTGEK